MLRQAQHERGLISAPFRTKAPPMQARIFQRPKNAMQSGKALTDQWILEFAPLEAKKAVPCSSTSASRSRRTEPMAKKALVNKANKKPKFAVRGYTRCQRCGRPKSVYRKFGLCRICLREMAHRGELPGVTKSSW